MSTVSQVAVPASVSQFADFKSQIHKQWRRDREARLRVPMREAMFRGCVGFAVRYAPDAGFCHGGLENSPMLVRNRDVTWYCLRDLPVGHWPGVPAMDCREVNWASTTQATLRHGLPVIDFSRARNSWDFRFMPFDRFRQEKPGGRFVDRLAGKDVLNYAEYPTEFAVFTKLSAAMTAAAFFGKDHEGRVVRRFWQEHAKAATLKPLFPAGREPKPFRLPDPRRWMPRAYLAFKASDAVLSQLYSAGTEAHVEGVAFDCPSCRRTIPSDAFNNERCQPVFFESGDFLARCPRCGHRRKWFLADGVPSRTRRYFSTEFRDSFCAAVGRGLPLCSSRTQVYLGVQHEADKAVSEEGRPLDLLAHAFDTGIGGQVLVYLPRTAELLVKPGEEVSAGDEWVKVLPAMPQEWFDLAVRDRWSYLADPCGGGAMVGFLQRLWFEHQMVFHGDQVLVPADLIPSAVRALPPDDLFWDMAPCGAFLDTETDAAIFPPVRITDWRQLQLSMPDPLNRHPDGVIKVDASVADPRFDPNPDKGRRKRRNESVDGRPTPRPVALPRPVIEEPDEEIDMAAVAVIMEEATAPGIASVDLPDCTPGSD